MMGLAPTLAIFPGFWGQVFEYWPFFFTVAVTLVFTLIALGADVVWRRAAPPPPGATPRIDIPVDPRIAPRRWIARGRTAVRFGCGIGVFIAFLYVSFAVNPPGVGEQYGLEQDSDPAVVVGASIALGAAVIGFGATLFLRKRPWQATAAIGIAAVLALTGTTMATGNPAWLGVNAAVMGLPVFFMMLGVVYTMHGLTMTRAVERAYGGEGGD